MISALGHCEDPSCVQSSSNHDLVRVFRCTIHCDRLLCLFHLNAHNVYYEEEKKQNDAVLSELQNCLTIYQTIFEQHIQAYRELVHQASTVLLHKASSIVPIEQIRPVLENLQRSIAIFQQEKIIIKSESNLDRTEFDIDKIDFNLSKDIPSIKKEAHTPKKTPVESGQTVVVRLERVDYNKEIQSDRRINDEQTNENQYEVTKDDKSDNDITIDSISSIHDDEMSHVLRPGKSNDEAQKQENKRARILSPAGSGKKTNERIKKKNDKTVPLKRLQT